MSPFLFLGKFIFSPECYNGIITRKCQDIFLVKGIVKRGRSPFLIRNDRIILPDNAWAVQVEQLWFQKDLESLLGSNAHQ